ncbi:hypothetical protein [Gelidibacter pelagius]|uniref:Uncharacterized protein n=1 Tax=Gelidibacter pelagius TaxID=2819985 RepID=A0ABS3SMP7_9FLAO|nr:hypothetical protein [Gelidibacter pelagius]MBO3096972.1 hypothetical protein [Gelidibacter pelagius]
MDISLNMVMLVVVLIVIVPFAWFIWAEKSAVSKKKKTFQKIAQAQNLKLSMVEYWNNHCLGYDDQENILLYNNLSTPDSEFKKVELEDVRKCVINKTNKDYKNGDKHYSEMMRLDLEFTFVSNKPPMSITLFNVDDNFSQNQELARAEKWLAFVDKHKYNKNNIVAA